MIVYQLACGQGHFFEGWFASSEACEQQAVAGQLQCPACSSADVRKVPSAPYVKDSVQAAPVSNPAERARVRAQAVKALRTYILANTDDVGREFAEVARRMHYEEEAARNIRGQVTPEEATELQEEGVPAFAISPEVIPSGEIH
jgi:hypothetical protein